jgi:NAD(P)-dependent dehydrogenase (short-subunit alcohol dehydrogenase family)
VIADLSVESARKLATECQAAARNGTFQVEAIAVDVALENSVDNAMRHATEAFERVDYCVNCERSRSTNRRILQYDPTELGGQFTRQMS